MWPGPSTITCVPRSWPRRGELAEHIELGELRLVAGVGDRAGPQAVAQAPGDIVLPHDVAQIVEVRVERILLAVGHHPLGDQRAAAADDAGDAVHRQVQVLEHHAAVDRHVVDALLRLVLDHVEKMLRPHVFDLAAQLFEHLVNRHRADRHGRGGDDRLADRVDVLAGREVHHRVGAEVDGVCSFSSSPSRLLVTAELPMLAFTLQLGGDADAHRLEPARQVDRVRRNHHPAGGHFAANQLGLELLALGDEIISGVVLPARACSSCVIGSTIVIIISIGSRSKHKS